MKIIIAEDEPISRAILEQSLIGWGHGVVVASNGESAWKLIEAENKPQFVILDWMMPIMDGPEVCRRIRASKLVNGSYVILLTARAQKNDVVQGLDSGADDYLTKPFDRQELRSRIRAGERILSLQRTLADRVQELELAMNQVKQLKGMLPICSYCKKIRDDGDYWQQVEEYVATHTDAYFSHGICPGCWESKIQPELIEMGVSPEKAAFCHAAVQVERSL